jgi:hypothetical protein
MSGILRRLLVPLSLVIFVVPSTWSIAGTAAASLDLATRVERATNAVGAGFDNVRDDSLLWVEARKDHVVVRKAGDENSAFATRLAADIGKTFGVPIRVERSVFSMTEYDALVRRHGDVLFNLPKPVARFHLLLDGSGVEFESTKGLDDQTKDRLASVFVKEDPDIRVEFSVKAAEETRLFDGRYDDGNPINGGAAMVAPNGVGCSTGMRAQRRTTGEYVMLTAQHCAEEGGANSWRTLSGGSQIGNNVNGTHFYDATYIRAAENKSFAQSIYTGSYYSLTTRPILTGYAPGLNTTVYTSGGLSGQATADVVDAGEYIGDIGPLFVAEFRNGLRNAGRGDSGGPIYNVNENDNGVGRGLITGGRNLGPCAQGADEVNVGRLCGTQVLFASLTIQENLLDVDVG